MRSAGCRRKEDHTMPNNPKMTSNGPFIKGTAKEIFKAIQEEVSICFTTGSIKPLLPEDKRENEDALLFYRTDLSRINLPNNDDEEIGKEIKTVDLGEIDDWGKLFDTLGVNRKDRDVASFLSVCPVDYYKSTMTVVQASLQSGKYPNVQLIDPLEPDVHVITGKPGDIYATYANALKVTKFKSEYSKSELANWLPEGAGYKNTVQNKLSNYDFETEISFDLNDLKKPDGLEKFFCKLGFSKQEMIGVEQVHVEQFSKDLFTALKADKNLQPKPVKSVKEAQAQLQEGKFTDLRSIADKGASAGQTVSMLAVDGAAKKLAEDVGAESADAESMLDDLKKTEGLLFRHSSKEYDKVRDALSEVIKLHKKIEAYNAETDETKRQKLAKEVPSEKELMDAYTSLDEYAETYLQVKEKRLDERRENNSPDKRGQKRFNVICSLRQITGPKARQRMEQRMAGFYENVQKDLGVQAEKTAQQVKTKAAQAGV